MDIFTTSTLDISKLYGAESGNVRWDAASGLWVINAPGTRMDGVRSPLQFPPPTPVAPTATAPTPVFIIELVTVVLLLALAR